MNRKHVRIVGLAVAFTGALTFGAACGDDASDNDAAGPLADKTRDVAAYCEATVALETVGDPEISESATPEEIAATLTAYGEQLRPLADKVVETAPAEIATDLDKLSAAVGRLGKVDGDPFEDPDTAAAMKRVHTFDRNNCDWQTVALTATDYHFDGSLPTRAGVTSFDVVNEGDEFHLAILGRKLDSVAESAEEAFTTAEGEEQFAQRFEMMATAAVPPGEGEYFIADLEPGEYVLFCPVPTGSTGGNEGDGPPHFTHGMVETFTIS